MYYTIVKILTMYLIQQSGAFHFVGNYHFQDVTSFMTTGGGCGVIPWNISLSIKKEYSNTDAFCMVFLKSVNNYDAKSHISNVHVKYLAYGTQYNFEVDHSPCNPRLNLQNVEMVMFCQGKTVLNGTICKRNEDCDRKMEECRRHKDINLQICIPKRHVYESCDEYTQCEKNSKCMSSGNIRTCRCFSGYEEIDGQCVNIGLFLGESCTNDDQCSGTEFATQCLYNKTKHDRVCSCINGYVSNGSSCVVDGLVIHEPCEVSQQCTGTTNAQNCNKYKEEAQALCTCNDGYIELYAKCYKMNLRLFESCVRSEQCTGSTGANECRIVEGQQICYCPEGKDIIKGACLKAGLVLGDNCYVSAQCTGTPNSGVCMIDHQGNVTLICQCNSGFIRYGDRCLQVNKNLYEECEIDEQCNGTLREEVLVCKTIRHRKLCMCDSDYVEDSKYLKCRKARKEVHKKCRINEQCTGTENANTCFTNGTEENEEGVCRCNDQFGWIDGKCLKIGMKLFEPCVNNNQCNGTNNAGNCTEIGHNTLCYCQDDYLDFKGRCIKGNKDINEECEANIQCTGTEHAGVCGEKQTCTCDKGFIRLKEECVSGNLTLGQSCVHDTQCTGTEYVGTCIEGVCFCNEGYDLYQLQCLPAKEKLTWFSEYENQLVLIAVGGLFGMVACSVTTLFCALNRRKSKPTRIECRNSSHLPINTIHYSVADNTVFGIKDHVEGVNQESYIYDQAKNIYEKHIKWTNIRRLKTSTTMLMKGTKTMKLKTCTVSQNPNVTTERRRILSTIHTITFTRNLYRCLMTLMVCRSPSRFRCNEHYNKIHF